MHHPSHGEGKGSVKRRGQQFGNHAHASLARMTRAAAASRPIAAETGAAIESMIATLAVAEALLDSGRGIDLAGLDAAARKLCAAVLALGPSEARPMRGGLEELARRVDRLRATLAPVWP
jgi:hypothetical protein